MVIPNSWIFQHALTNETYTKKFRLHIITAPLSTDDNWEKAEQLLLKAGQEEAAPFIEEARTYKKTGRKTLAGCPIGRAKGHRQDF